MKAEFGQLQSQVRQMLEAGAAEKVVVDHIANSGWSTQEFVALNKGAQAGPGPRAVPQAGSGDQPTPPPATGTARPPLAYGPAASRQPAVQGPSKTQTEDFNKAVAARNDMSAATNRMRQLLEEGGGQTAMFGDRATKFGIASQQVVTALGSLGNAGVLQPSDIDRFTRMFGDPSSLSGYLGNATGIRPLGAALEELDNVVGTKVRNRASEAGVKVFSTDEEADAGVASLPPGTPFIGPDGQQYRKAK